MHAYSFFFMDLNQMRKVYIEAVFWITRQRSVSVYNQSLFGWISFCICLFFSYERIWCNIAIPMKVELLYSNEDTSLHKSLPIGKWITQYNARNNPYAFSLWNFTLLTEGWFDSRCEIGCDLILDFCHLSFVTGLFWSIC